MNLHRLKIKGDELLSQEYDRDRTVQYKQREAKLPNITSPDMIDICEVRDEYHDDTSPVVMGAYVNKNLYEIHRDVSELDIENIRDTMKMIIEECPDYTSPVDMEE